MTGRDESADLARRNDAYRLAVLNAPEGAPWRRAILQQAKRRRDAKRDTTRQMRLKHIVTQHKRMQRGTKRATVARLAEIAAVVNGLTYADLTGVSRLQNCVGARHAAMWMGRWVCNAHHAHIGRVLNRNRSAVRRGADKIERDWPRHRDMVIACLRYARSDSVQFQWPDRIGKLDRLWGQNGCNDADK